MCLTFSIQSTFTSYLGLFFFRFRIFGTRMAMAYYDPCWCFVSWLMLFEIGYCLLLYIYVFCIYLFIFFIDFHKEIFLLTVIIKSITVSTVRI